MAHSEQTPPRIIFAGDRTVAVAILEFIQDQGTDPVALLLPDGARASHAAALTSRCSHLDPQWVFSGRSFDSGSIDRLASLSADYILSVHYPHVLPEALLRLPCVASLNLHPALLPYNRGWHTPSWAILDDTPYGATLHCMTDRLDAGDIVHQRQLHVRPDDTAHRLYQRAMALEVEVFKEAWPALVSQDVPRRPQSEREATAHAKRDLLRQDIQHIDREEILPAGDLIDRLRALTTNALEEAAYFESEGHRYRVQIRIVKDD